ACAVGTVLPSATLLAQTTAPLAQTIQNDIEQTAQTLKDESAKQDERDEAARRLVSRQTDQANEILRSALVGVGNRGAQLAVAKALAADRKPDQLFIDPLFALIGPDRVLSEAAAQALAQYKNDLEVLSRLITIG